MDANNVIEAIWMYFFAVIIFLLNYFYIYETAFVSNNTVEEES